MSLSEMRAKPIRPVSEFTRDTNGNIIAHAVGFSGPPEIIIVGSTIEALQESVSRLGFEITDPSKIRTVRLTVIELPGS